MPENAVVISGTDIKVSVGLNKKDCMLACHKNFCLGQGHDQPCKNYPISQDTACKFCGMPMTALLASTEKDLQEMVNQLNMPGCDWSYDQCR